MRQKLKGTPKPAPSEQAPERAEEESRGPTDTPDFPAGGSAFVSPPSFGGAALVKDARDAALKIRSLLG